MRLIITLPDRKPTPADHDSIQRAVNLLGVTLHLGSSPPWSLESTAPPLTTRQAADLCGITMDGLKKAMASHGYSPAGVVGRTNLWSQSDVAIVRDSIRRRNDERARAAELRASAWIGDVVITTASDEPKTAMPKGGV